MWAYVEGSASSAAYWLVSACGKIVGAPTSLSGSIGTLVSISEPPEGSPKQYSIISNLSPNKALDPKTDTGKNEILSILDSLTNVFIDNVAAGRNVSRETILQDFGQGSVFAASEAKNRGLIDDIQTQNQTLANLKETAMAKKENTPVAITAEQLKANHPEAVAELEAAAEANALETMQADFEKDLKAEKETAAAAATVAERTRCADLLAACPVGIYGTAQELISKGTDSKAAAEEIAAAITAADEMDPAKRLAADAAAVGAVTGASPEVAPVETKTSDKVRAARRGEI